MFFGLQSEALDPKLTVIDTMVQAAPDAKMNDIKSLLGRMMFSGKSMEKMVRFLCVTCQTYQALLLYAR